MSTRRSARRGSPAHFRLDAGPRKRKLTAHRELLPQRRQRLQTEDDTLDGSRVLGRQRRVGCEPQRIRALAGAAPPVEIAHRGQALRSDHVVVLRFVRVPQRGLPALLLASLARPFPWALARRFGGDEGASTGGGAPVDAGGEAELGFDDVVDQVVRDVGIEPWRRVHDLRGTALDREDDRVASLAGAAEDHVHGAPQGSSPGGASQPVAGSWGALSLPATRRGAL